LAGTESHDGGVHALVTLAAQYLLYVVAALALFVWLLLPRPDKVALAVEMVVGLVAVAVLVKVAGAVHTDPRPFVTNPSLKPYFAHAADNGFPSDHTSVAAVTTFLVLRRRPLAGAGLLALTLLLGISRVVAHVHHPQDIVAGLVIGLVSAALGALAWPAARRTTWAARLMGEPATTAEETASPGSSSHK
jgi:membrane-associated phospholipid phosphatase